MGARGLTAMRDDREDLEALAAAGYTGARGAALFSLLLALIGALVGSVVIAIVLGFLMPESSEALRTTAGALIGAALAALVGLEKVRRGNLEAREEVEDRAWRRLVRRQHGK